MFPFERLDVWTQAHALAVDLFHATALWREWEIRAQVRRCSASVAANLAEGAGAATPALFARFVGIAQASAAELRYQLLYARDVGLMPAAEHEAFEQRAVRTCKMLSSLRTAILRNAKAGARPRSAPPPP